MEKMMMEMMKRLEALEKRVAELEAENEELLERIDDLENTIIEEA
jgi:chaperonin cofactor prefoldin